MKLPDFIGDENGVRARVLCDSVNAAGDRLTTMEVVIHRFVLAEFNTHRMFTRSSASSRAIPVEKQLAKIRDNPAWPLVWAAEQKGMQGGAELEGRDLADAQGLFHATRSTTLALIEQYLEARSDKTTRLHKSLINRLIEPFMWHTVIVSATEFENFFRLRCSPLAQPEIHRAADLMLAGYEPPSEELMAVLNIMEKAYRNSTPTFKAKGEWHTPLVDDEDWAWATNTFSSREKVGQAIRHISVARCARVSYLTHEGVRDQAEDVAMFGRLRDADPPHAAPLEHVATADLNNKTHMTILHEDGSPTRHLTLPKLGNFLGWTQLRHLEVRF